MRQARLGSSPASGSPMELGRFKSDDSASHGTHSTNAAAAAAADAGADHQPHNSPFQDAVSGSATARQSPKKLSSNSGGRGGTVASIDPQMRSRLQSAAFDKSVISTAPAESTVQLLVDLTQASERQCVTALSLAKNDVEYAIRLLHMSPQVRSHRVLLALGLTLLTLTLPRVNLWVSLITVSP